MIKVKKFDNIWTMGLILFGAILVFFYIAKLFFPEWIIGVAETPRIVEIGEYIDTHRWAYYLFYFVLTTIPMYFYCCACCRKGKLSKYEGICLASFCLISFLIEAFLPDMIFVYNNVAYIALPLIFKVMSNDKKDIFYSTSLCFIVTSFAQALSLSIRDISTLISFPNTATFCILMIDGYIWNILLYLYFNFKGGKENG